MNEVKSPLLKESGLNMLAIFNLESLPAELFTTLNNELVDISRFSQLLVFAQAGKNLWQALNQSAFADVEQPIDNFSLNIVQNYFAQELPNNHYQSLYPDAKSSLSLQKLGELAGWHHQSPFRIGINEQFGSWFAYRVVVLADTSLIATTKMDSTHPCLTCEDKPCIPICPANALAQGDLSQKTCINYRLVENSICKDQCLSRLACPVAKAFRYSREQINYHYNVSKKMIETINERLIHSGYLSISLSIV